MPLPFAEVFAPTISLRFEAQRYEVTTGAYRHEMAVIRTYDDTRSRFPTGLPISMRWGDYPRIQKNFVGYVHHTEPLFDRDDDRYLRQVVDVVCIGTTAPLSEEESRTWMHTRIDLVAQDMANLAGTELTADTDGVVLSNIVQGAESSWKFLTRRAKEAGLVLYAQGPRIFLRDREKVMRELHEYATVIRRGEESRLTGAVGEIAPDRGAYEREGYGLDRSGNLVAATDRSRYGNLVEQTSPMQRRIVSGSARGDAGQVKRAIEAQRREETFLHEVKLTLPRILPTASVCAPVVLSGYGERYDGLWSTNAVTSSSGAQNDPSTVLELIKAPPAEYATPKPGQRPLGTERDSVRLVGSRWVAGSLEVAV
jgi:hypothetical protein